jgi:hypothetical protein
MLEGHITSDVPESGLMKNSFNLLPEYDLRK